MSSKPPVPPRRLAPHVQQAVAAVQAKAQAIPERARAAHVQAALNQGTAQPRAPLGAPAVGTGTREPAPHVRNALKATVQAKPQSSNVRPPAPHVQAALARTAPAGRNVAVQPSRPNGPGAHAAPIPRPSSGTTAGPRWHHRVSPPAVPRFTPPVLQASLVSSTQEKAQQVVSEVHSGLLKAGPGNLSGSTKGARQLFNQAHSLLEALRNHRDMHFTVLDALARIHFKLSSEKGMVQHLNDMSDEEAIQIGQFKKGETVDQARNLKTLADAVYFDFVLEKTGGGSCDHSSAATFFKLTEAFPEAKIKIVRYKPKSGGGYEIQPPEGLPWHRTVFFKNEEDRLNVDSWWPEGGKIESREELDYPEVETVVKWSSLNKAFVAALRIELEHQYKQIQGELPTEVDDTVGAVWTISTG